MKVLIIEDEYSLADAIAETLKNEKFNVNIETNGEDGEDEDLPVNAQAAYCRDDGKNSTNGEADDEEVTR